jgi:hypothetical protein
VEPLADIVAPADRRAATTAFRRTGVEDFELFEPASPRDEARCADAPQRLTGVGPDAADRTVAAAYHVAARQNAVTDALMSRSSSDDEFAHIVDMIEVTEQEQRSQLQ